MSVKRLLAIFSVILAVPTAALHAAEQRGRPDLYLNPTLGFNIEGYSYSQSEFPCQIDSVLVSEIRDYAEKQGLDVRISVTESELERAAVPILAIDIEALSLGKDFSFGTEARSNLPSVHVVAALIGKQFAEGYITAEHSCSIATLNELTPSSNVLDLGTYGVTVCSATHKCLNKLARDIVDWAEPRIEQQASQP